LKTRGGGAKTGANGLDMSPIGESAAAENGIVVPPIETEYPLLCQARMTPGRSAWSTAKVEVSDLSGETVRMYWLTISFASFLLLIAGTSSVG